MNMEIVLVLTILTVAIILFATEWLRMDLVSLLVLLALGLSGLVSVEEAFSGFSNPAVITVAAMFVISAAIASTGATGKLGEKLLQVAGSSEPRLIIVIMLTVASFSAFINNIGSTAVLMPLVISMGRKAHIPPSRLLIPLAFGSLMGGVCTLIGTPPNILMNALMQQYSGESFSMFDFTPVGVAILIVGTLYMAFVGRHLLPKRKSGTLTRTGVTDWFAALLGPVISDAPLLVSLVLLVFVSALLTNLLNNTTITAVFVPILISLARDNPAFDPVQLVLPVTLATTFGYSLPSASGRMALIAATGIVSRTEMMRYGLIVTLASSVVLALFFYALALVGWI